MFDNIPMFEEQDEAVHSVFYDGAISVVLKGNLTKLQVKAFVVGCQNVVGVRQCKIDDCQAHSSENTCFLVDMRPGAAVKAFDIKASIQAFAERFMSEITPDAVQSSLF